METGRRLDGKGQIKLPLTHKTLKNDHICTILALST